MSKLI